MTRSTDNPYPENAVRIYSEVEIQAKASFLLGESDSPGRAEFHVMFVDVLENATHETPAKINWYMATALDSTPTFSDSGAAGVYAKLLKIVTYSFLTTRDPGKEQWEGTLVATEGTLRAPQK